MKRLNAKIASWFHTAARILPVIVGLAALTLVIAWISGVFQQKIEPGESPQVVQKLDGQPTDVVHEVVKDYIEESVGTLKAASRSVISAKILATIQEIHVSAGDFVDKGDLLVSSTLR